MEAIAERQSTAQPSALPDRWIVALFDRFAMTYGSEKFAQMWRGQQLVDVRAFWASQLAALSADELRAGAEQLRPRHPTWPPTLHEFIELCRPSAATIDPEGAFHEAVRGLEARKHGKMGEWSSRAIYWAAIDVSAFDMLGVPYPHLRARWTRALEARMRDANLPQIPEPSKQLPAPAPVSRSEAAVALDNLRADIGHGGRSQRANPIAWADSIIERAKNGDPLVTPIVLAIARDAERIRYGGIRPRAGEIT